MALMADCAAQMSIFSPQSGVPQKGEHPLLYGGCIYSFVHKQNQLSKVSAQPKPGFALPLVVVSGLPGSPGAVTHSSLLWLPVFGLRTR